MGLAKVSAMCSQDSGAVNQVRRIQLGLLDRGWSWPRGVGGREWGSELELGPVRGDLRTQVHLLVPMLSPGHLSSCLFRRMH